MVRQVSMRISDFTVCAVGRSRQRKKLLGCADIPEMQRHRRVACPQVPSKPPRFIVYDEEYSVLLIIGDFYVNMTTLGTGSALFDVPYLFLNVPNVNAIELFNGSAYIALANVVYSAPYNGTPIGGMAQLTAVFNVAPSFFISSLAWHAASRVRVLALESPHTSAVCNAACCGKPSVDDERCHCLLCTMV